jgi:hypothetical protein
VAVVTQLYNQVYIAYQQLHVSAIAAVAIIRLDTIFQRIHIIVIYHITITSNGVGKRGQDLFYIRLEGVCAESKRIM